MGRGSSGIGSGNMNVDWDKWGNTLDGGDFQFIYDKDGNTEPFGFYNDRVAAMRLEEIRRIPSKIGIAGGQRKVNAVIGAIRGGYINTLITDTECAKKLIELSER